MDVIPPVVINILLQLNLLSESEQKKLANYIEPDNLNDVKKPVGKIKVVAIW